jgi:hypothetical protein
MRTGVEEQTGDGWASCQSVGGARDDGMPGEMMKRGAGEGRESRCIEWSVEGDEWRSGPAREEHSGRGGEGEEVRTERGLEPGEECGRGVISRPQ